MRPRSNLTIFRFLAGWLASGLLTIAPIALAGNEAENAKKRAEEEEQRIRTQRTGGNSYSAFPLTMISPGIKFEAGKVSLIPDPTDQGGGRIAVYLINATDQPLKWADSVTLRCFLEVRDSGQWRACESYLADCGNNPPPKDLPPGYGKIFVALDPSVGDATGELRYCVTLFEGGPVVSASFPGKYNSQKLEEATFPGRAGAAILNGLHGKDWSDSWWSVAHTPEECLAAAELDRCEGGFTTTHSALVRWKDRNLPGDEMARCRVVSSELLGRPWYPEIDGSRLIQRCLLALDPGAGERAEFGSPEHCRATIWRYLKSNRRRIELFINPERWEQMKRNQLSDNPWGADRESVSALVQEALASLHSPRPDEREAVAEFLRDSWITAVYWPDDSCWKVFEKGVPRAKIAALHALERRGKRAEAGKWLADHRMNLSRSLGVYWETLADRAGDFADWEIPVAAHVLESSPLEASSILLNRLHAFRPDGGKNKLPDALQAPLRAFLVEEAYTKRFKGKPYEATKAVSKRNSYEDSASQYLGEALKVLASLENPEDTPLLRSFLDHPAAGYGEGSKGVIRFYGVRTTAAQLLKARGEQIPSDVIFEEIVSVTTGPLPVFPRRLWIVAGLIITGLIAAVALWRKVKKPR